MIRYFWICLVVLAVDAVALYAMRGKQILSSEVIRLAGYLGAFMVMTLPAALFGFLIGGSLLVARVNSQGQRTFFGTAAVINFIMVYCTFALISQSFDHCASPCVPPSPTALLYVALAGTVLTVIPPAVIYFTGRRVFRPEYDGPSDSMR